MSRVYRCMRLVLSHTKNGLPSALILFTNSLAAALAASMRVGLRSSADMLPDTSKVRMTVPSIFGRLITACGRASERISTVMPTRKRIAGRCRRVLEAPRAVPVASARDQRQDRLLAPPVRVALEELDRVMAKLQREGVGRLTDGEKEFLERFSQR